VVDGEEHLRELAGRGGPAVFFSGHIGNWEVLPAVLATHGIPMAGFYRPARNKLVDRLIMQLRRPANGMAIQMFPKGATGARLAVGHLLAKGFLAVLVDQKMNDGIPVPLFGRTAMTAPAAAALALRFGCPVVPGYVERIGPARFRVICEAPLSISESGDRQADIAALTRAMNACLERWISARPDSWLWLHRRWPSEPPR
jgi:KDO2-lipid IV(A) lauroyltransferase